MNENAAPMASLGEDQKSYMQYIYSYLVSQEVVMRDRIDRDSEAYQAWAAETVSLREYLYKGIAENWIDTTKA